MINALCHLCCSDENTVVNGLSWLWCDGKTSWLVMSSQKWSFSGAWRRPFRDSDRDYPNFLIIQTVFFTYLFFPHSIRGSFDFPPLTLQLSLLLGLSREVAAAEVRPVVMLVLWRHLAIVSLCATPLDMVRVSTVTKPFVIKLICLPSQTDCLWIDTIQICAKNCFTHPSEANTISSFCSGLLNHFWNTKTKKTLFQCSLSSVINKCVEVSVKTCPPVVQCINNTFNFKSNLMSSLVCASLGFSHTECLAEISSFSILL